MGWFAVLDSALRDMRFSITSRPASGNIVFVETDAAAMAQAGSQSRARSVYAHALGDMIDAGARTVVLDVGLQGELGYFDDNALVEAMTRASGRVHTVATETRSSDGARSLSMPADRFAALAPPVYIDAVGGNRRSGGYRARIVNDGWVIESHGDGALVGPPRTAPVLSCRFFHRSCHHSTDDPFGCDRRQLRARIVQGPAGHCGPGQLFAAIEPFGAPLRIAFDAVAAASCGGNGSPGAGADRYGAPAGDHYRSGHGAAVCVPAAAHDAGFGHRGVAGLCRYPRVHGAGHASACGHAARHGRHSHSAVEFSGGRFLARARGAGALACPMRRASAIPCAVS